MHGCDLPGALHRLLWALLETDPRRGKEVFNTMTPLYIAGGLIAVALLIYLFIALLKPEFFS